LRNSDNVLLLF